MGIDNNEANAFSSAIDECEGLTAEDVRHIDQACDQFESAWQKGPPPSIAEFLGQRGEPMRSVLLRQLLLLDWEYGRRHHLDRAVADYDAQFPDDRSLIAAVANDMVQPDPSTYVAGNDDSWKDSVVPPLNHVGGLNFDESPSRRFEFQQEIGHGGVGMVFRAWDRVLERELAVKVLRESYQENSEARRRFIEEARIGGRLQHPAIVPVYDLGNLMDCRPMFSMKLVEGHTLAALLKKRADPETDLPRFLEIFEQVCQAMAYAHSQNVIHRDLKPANIMVGAFGEVQVMDWGFAKQLSASEGAEHVVPGLFVANNGEAPTDGKGRSPSQSGMMMGTPAYMPPEQAQGHLAKVDARADVFALGAILCEILTGEPPYRDGGEDVVRQAYSADLHDAHGRLQACRADEALRTLARQCLNSDRDARPLNASVIVDQLKAYTSAAQDRLHQANMDRAAADARAEQAAAKAKAERRARRFMLGLTGALALLIALAGGAYWWQDRVQREKALQAAAINSKIEAALAEANESVNRKDWVRANTAALRAKELLGPGVNPQTRESVDQLCDDLNLVKRMDLVLVMQARFDPVRRQHSRPLAVPGYEKVFLTHKLAPPHTINDAVARIAQKPPAIREVVIAGLDNWRMHAFKSEPKLFAWIDAVLQQADKDEWRWQTRQAVTNNDRAALIELAAREIAVEQPPVSITMMSWALRDFEEYDSALALLRKVQPRHPNDFWINMEIAQCLMRKTPPDITELAHYYRIAWALRPDSISYITLSVVFNDCKDYGNMLIAAEKAVALNPKDPSAYYHRGIALEKLGRVEESELDFRKAVELDGKNHLFQNGHGVSLVANRRYAEGVAAHERAIQLEPQKAAYYFTLGIAHEKNNNLQAAEAAYRKAIELKPDYSEAYCNLGIVLDLVGRLDESIACHESALRLNPAYFDYWNNLGGVRHKKKQYDLAITAFRRAIELDPNKAIAWDNLSVVMDAKHDWSEAIHACREAIRLDPQHSDTYFRLGRALLEDGEFKEGLAAIVRGREISKGNPVVQIRTAVLLKEAERLVEMDARLPAVVAREIKPASMDELTTFAKLSSRKGRTAEAASLFAEVLSTRPATPLSKDYYEAIRSAAWAGCGKGKDAPTSETERQKWRDQAYAWLRADLDFYRQSGDDSIQHRKTAQKKLRLWRNDRGLAELREPTSLARLSEPEWKKWLTFWAEVDAALMQSVAESNGSS